MPAMHTALPSPWLYDEWWKYTWRLTEMSPHLRRCRKRKRCESQDSTAQ